MEGFTCGSSMPPPDIARNGSFKDPASPNIHESPSGLVRLVGRRSLTQVDPWPMSKSADEGSFSLYEGLLDYVRKRNASGASLPQSVPAPQKTPNQRAFYLLATPHLWLNRVGSRPIVSC
eukprot:3302955-Amphidinium_carterae.1